MRWLCYVGFQKGTSTTPSICYIAHLHPVVVICMKNPMTWYVTCVLYGVATSYTNPYTLCHRLLCRGGLQLKLLNNAKKWGKSHEKTLFHNMCVLKLMDKHFLSGIVLLSLFWSQANLCILTRAGMSRLCMFNSSIYSISLTCYLLKSRLHAFRKLSPSSLHAADCHYSLREAILPSIRRADFFCLSVAWDWMYKGVSSEGINREVSSILECARLNQKHRWDWYTCKAIYFPVTHKNPQPKTQCSVIGYPRDFPSFSRSRSFGAFEDEYENRKQGR